MNPSDHNYYDILGVSHFAVLSDIKQAYRKQALLYHPDRNKATHASAHFRLISQAYKILKDPKTRTAYDHSLAIERYKTPQTNRSNENTKKYRTANPKEKNNQKSYTTYYKSYLKRDNVIIQSLKSSWISTSIPLVLIMNYLKTYESPLSFYSLLFHGSGYLAFVFFLLCSGTLLLLTKKYEKKFSILDKGVFYMAVTGLSLKILYTSLSTTRTEKFAPIIGMLLLFNLIAGMMSFRYYFSNSIHKIDIFKSIITAFTHFLILMILILPGLILAQSFSFPDEIYYNNVFWLGFLHTSIVTGLIGNILVQFFSRIRQSTS